MDVVVSYPAGVRGAEKRASIRFAQADALSGVFLVAASAFLVCEVMADAPELEELPVSPPRRPPPLPPVPTPKKDETGSDKHGKADIDDLYGAATATAAEIKEHLPPSVATSSSDGYETPVMPGEASSSARARFAARRSRILSSTMLARNRITSGAVSRPVVTGSAPGIAAATIEMITAA